MDDDRAVRLHADIGELVAWHHPRLALDPLDGAVAALLGVERKAHADGAAVGLALRLPRADGGQIDHVAGDVERGDIVAGVEPHAGGGAIRQFGRGDDVLPPQVERLAAELAGDLVDQPLDGEARARPRDAAVGTHRRLVGGDRIGLQAEMADAIRPGEIARRHARFHERARRPQRIGAGVDVDVALDAEQRAVPVGGDRQVVEVVAGVNRGEQVLAAILDPAHRVSDFQRERGDRDVFRHDVGSCRRSRRRHRGR